MRKNRPDRKVLEALVNLLVLEALQTLEILDHPDLLEVLDHPVVQGLLEALDHPEAQDPPEALDHREVPAVEIKLSTEEMVVVMDLLLLVPEFVRCLRLP